MLMKNNTIFLLNITPLSAKPTETILPGMDGSNRSPYQQPADVVWFCQYSYILYPTKVSYNF